MRRRMVLAIAAFVLAGLSVALMAAYVRNADERAVAGREPVRVYIATTRIPAGTSAADLLAKGEAGLVVMPAATVPPDALQSIDEALGTLVLTAPVERGQLLLRAMFDQASAVTGGLAVPDGMLAVSVPVKLEGAVAAYVSPGADVTLYLTGSGSAQQPGDDSTPDVSATRMATRVLLGRVRVLAVGVRPAATSGSERSAVDFSASDGSILLTLSVAQDDAQRLVLATRSGTLYAALLSPRTTVAPGGGVDTDRLFR